MTKFQITQTIEQGQHQKTLECSYVHLVEMLQADFHITDVVILDDQQFKQQELDSIKHFVDENIFYNDQCKSKSISDLLSPRYYPQTTTAEEIVEKLYTRILFHFLDGKNNPEPHDFTDQENSLLFSYACKHDNFKVAEWFVDKGIDVDQEILDSLTPLHVACKHNSLKVVKFLVSMEADTNSMDNQNMTPIFHAYQHADLEIAKFLSEAGANLNCRKEDNVTQFLYVCEQGSLEAAKWLADQKKVKISHKTKNGIKALHYACGAGHIEVAKWLVEEKGAEVDERDGFGDTPLHHACKSSGNFKICQWLIGDKEANVNSQNHTGESPLSASSQQYGLELFKWLVDQKMNAFPGQYSNMDSLLQYICGFNSYEAVKWLVEEKKANIDSKNPDGCTPLHIAVDKMHLRTVIYLLESGADCTIKSKYGELPLQIEQEDWCDFYQKLLDERVIENMPLIVMDVLPEEWYSSSNKLFLLTQLVATPAFVQISTNAEVAGELMDFHTGMSAHRYYDERESAVSSFVRSLEDFFEIVCETNRAKIQAVTCCQMMGKEWCQNPKNVRTLNKLGPKLINLHSRKICSSEDLLFVIKHPIQIWSSEKGFCKLLLQHFVIEERFDQVISLIKFEAGNLLKSGDFVKEALEELKSDHKEFVQQIEIMISPSRVDDASEQVVLGGDHEEGDSN